MLSIIFTAHLAIRRISKNKDPQRIIFDKCCILNIKNGNLSLLLKGLCTKTLSSILMSKLKTRHGFLGVQLKPLTP